MAGPSRRILNKILYMNLSHEENPLKNIPFSDRPFLTSFVSPLASWSIFLVTLENPALTILEILALYGLRWRIENIFKTWKSNFCFGKVHTVSEKQLRILLTVRLIMILVCYHYAYGPLSGEILRRSHKSLSLMKFMRYLRQNLDRLPLLLLPRFWNNPLLNAIARYCTYDQRKRQHFIAHFDAILDNLAQISA